MTRAIRYLIVLCGILALINATFAWDSTGHMIIAAMAWQEFALAERTRALAILQNHPEFAAWKRAFESGPKNVDFGAYAFMRAATWPDDIRGKDRANDHPSWHYVNLPLIPPDFPLRPSISAREDVIWAIEHNRRILADTGAAQEQRAIALSWLIHLIGDIHQPLHAVALVDSKHPKGDRGGNSFWVRPGNAPVSLHHLWDGLLGSSKNIRSAFNEATRLRTAFPESALPELATAKTPREWALESRAVAIETVYQRGSLRGAKDKRDAPPLPPGYTKEAKRVAERRAELASARLCTIFRTNSH